MNPAKLLLGVIALATVLAGCVGDRPTATPNPDPVCDAAESLQASLSALRQMEAVNTTVDEVKIAAAASKAAYEDLKEQLKNFSQERVSALSSAMRDLETAAGQLPPGLTVANAADLLAEEIAAVRSAWQALGSQLGCTQVTNPIAFSAS